MIETKGNNNEKNGTRDAALQKTCEPSDPSDSDISECVSSLDLGSRNKLFSKQQINLIKLRPSIISRHFGPICMASSTPMHPIPKISFNNSSVLSSINGKCVEDCQLPIPSTSSRRLSGFEEIESTVSGQKGEKSNRDVLERLQGQNYGVHSLTTRSCYGHRDTTSETSKLSAPFNKRKVIRKRSKSKRKSTLKRNSVHLKAKVYKYLKSIFEDFFGNSSDDTEDSSERPIKKNHNHKTVVSVIPDGESTSTFIENQTSDSSSNSFIYNVPIDIPPLTNCMNGVINSTEKQKPLKHAPQNITNSHLVQQVQKFLNSSAISQDRVINNNDAKNASQISRKCFNTKTQKLLVGDKEKATQQIDEPINPHGQINCKIPKSVNNKNKTKQTKENTKDASLMESCGSNDNVEKFADGEEKSTKNHHSDHADLTKKIRSRKSRSEIPKWRTIANASKAANNIVGERLLESLESVSPLRGRRSRSQIRKSFICDVSKSITNTVEDVCLEDDQINSKITPQKLVGDKHFSKKQTLENIINTVTRKSKKQKSVVNAEVTKQSKDFAKHNLVSGSENKKLSESIQNQKNCTIDGQLCEDVMNDNRNTHKLSKTQMSLVCDKDVEKTLQEIHGQCDDEIKSTNSEKCTNNKNKRKEIMESTKEISPLNKRPRSSRNIGKSSDRGKSTKNNLTLQNTIDISKENIDITESPKSRYETRKPCLVDQNHSKSPNSNTDTADTSKAGDENIVGENLSKSLINELQVRQIKSSDNQLTKNQTPVPRDIAMILEDVLLENNNQEHVKKSVQNLSTKLIDENVEKADSFHKNAICEVPKEKEIRKSRSKTRKSHTNDDENQNELHKSRKLSDENPDNVTSLQDRMGLCKNSFIDGCTTSTEQSSLKENLEHAPPKKRGRKKKRDTSKEMQSTTVFTGQGNQMELCKNSFIDGCTTSTEQSSLKENLAHAPPKKRGRKNKQDTNKEMQSTTVLTDQGNQMELCKNSFIDGCTTSTEQSSLKENLEYASSKKRGRKKKQDTNKEVQCTTVLIDRGNQMELCKNSFIDGCTTFIEQISLKENLEHTPPKKRGRKTKQDLQSTAKENTKEGNKTVTMAQTNEIDLIQNQSKTDESDEDTRNISKLPKLRKIANTDISKCIKEDVEKKHQQPNQPPKKRGRKKKHTHSITRDSLRSHNASKQMDRGNMIQNGDDHIFKKPFPVKKQRDTLEESENTDFRRSSRNRKPNPFYAPLPYIVLLDQNPKKRKKGKNNLEIKTNVEVNKKTRKKINNIDETIVTRKNKKDSKLKTKRRTKEAECVESSTSQSAEFNNYSTEKTVSKGETNNKISSSEVAKKKRQTKKTAHLECSTNYLNEFNSCTAEKVSSTPLPSEFVNQNNIFDGLSLLSKQDQPPQLQEQSDEDFINNSSCCMNNSEYITIVINNEVCKVPCLNLTPNFQSVEENPSILISQNFEITKAGVPSGHISIKPGGQKMPQISKKFATTFFVYKGEAELKIHDRCWLIESEATFFVPLGVKYMVRNASKKVDLHLFYVTSQPPIK